MTALNAFNIKFYKSTNPVDGISSLGGAIDLGSEVVSFTLNNIFDRTDETQANSGITKFRCIYVKNEHATESILNPLLLIPQNTSSPNDEVSVGWAPEALNGTAESIDDQFDPPVNVTFVFGQDRTNSAVLGQSIPAGATKAFWLRLVSKFDAQGFLVNGLILRLVCDNLVTSVIDQAPTPSSNTSFTVTGESDVNDDLSTIIKKIKNRNCNFHISVGNNCVSSTDADDYFNMLGESLKRIMKTAFGANDMTSQSQINQYLNSLGIAHKYHSFTFQNCHFLFMDTIGGPSTYDQASEQFEFVVNDLKSASGDNSVDWIIAVMNRDMYASQTDTTTRYVLKSLRDIYHTIFEQNGVHVVLQGNFRNYQRHHVLQFNAANSDNPTTVLSGDEPDYSIAQGNRTFDDGSGGTGCLFITCGTGGASHDNITSVNSHTAFNNTADFGYMLFDLINDSTTRKIKGYFYKSLDDSLIDRFTITKTL